MLNFINRVIQKSTTYQLPKINQFIILKKNVDCRYRVVIQIFRGCISLYIILKGHKQSRKIHSSFSCLQRIDISRLVSNINRKIHHFLIYYIIIFTKCASLWFCMFGLPANIFYFNVKKIMTNESSLLFYLVNLLLLTDSALSRFVLP